MKPKGHHLVIKHVGLNKYETKEVEIGATNDRFVTIKSGLAEGDSVVLNPRQHQDIMDIPEFADVNDRDKLIEIGKSAPPATASTGPAEARTRSCSGWRSGAAPGGGRPNPAQIVDMILQNTDTDGDGKISKEEASSNERMASRFADQDKNGDGFVDKAELVTSMKNFGGRPGGGGPGGYGGPGGPGGPRP